MAKKRSIKVYGQSGYLVFNNDNIPMPASYSVNLSDVEADSGGVTEAGKYYRGVSGHGYE